ncbi:MAG: polynucleotide adenylyltransferase PcnB [Chromatiales bacterium]
MTDNLAASKVIRLATAPRIIPRADHCISRANVSEHALKVLYRLHNAGYQAYLVGGSVRDLLLGREPKDFDVATNARPEQVRELFRNCRLIGRRFRLAHVHFGQEIIEVATFRAGDDEGSGGERVTEGGRILRDNVYGHSVEDDVWRRDFTINALYYNIADFTVVDYVGGMADIQAGQLRLIGDPMARFREDPVRLLRAVRFAVKLGLNIHADTERPLLEMGQLLDQIPSARLFEEVLKLFLGGFALATFERLRHYRLFGHLFPDVEDALAEEMQGFPKMLLIRALENTDRRLAEDKPVTPAFLFAALLWAPLRRRMQQYLAQGHATALAMELAQDDVISRQAARVAVPRRFTQVTREIWSLQWRLEQPSPKAALRLLAHPRFRAAYDFLLLRQEAGETLAEAGDWWTRFQDESEKNRAQMLSELPRQGRRRGRRRKSREGDPGARRG